MSKVQRIVLDKKGVKNLLKSKEVKEMLEHQATEIKAKVGKDYGSDIYLGKNRYNVAIYPITDEARKDAINNDTLTKVVFNK